MFKMSRCVLFSLYFGSRSELRVVAEVARLAPYCTQQLLYRTKVLLRRSGNSLKNRNFIWNNCALWPQDKDIHEHLRTKLDIYEHGVVLNLICRRSRLTVGLLRELNIARPQRLVQTANIATIAPICRCDRLASEI